MKFWQAYKIFRFLLKDKEWYIIADDAKNHIIDMNITKGKLIITTERIINDFDNQEALLDEAKQILKHE